MNLFDALLQSQSNILFYIVHEITPVFKKKTGKDRKRFKIFWIVSIFSLEEVDESGTN